MTACHETCLAKSPPMPALPDQVRDAHRRCPTCVTVVTAATDGVPAGLAVNAFTSVSTEPPLVLVCVNRSAKSYPVVMSSPRLGINVLAADQVDVARRFARSGGDKFTGLDWHMSARGVPLVGGAVARFEVAVRHQTPAATHTIFLAEVIHARTDAAKDPLVYLEGGFYDGHELVPVEDVR